MLSSGEGDRMAACMHDDEVDVAFTTLVREPEGMEVFLLFLRYVRK
jgi:hypothetical protein